MLDGLEAEAARLALAASLSRRETSGHCAQAQARFRQQQWQTATVKGLEFADAGSLRGCAII
jgi:predicted transcriptional regulator